ncbi:glycosyltransferase family 2 protein [Ekhidna sp.]|uniref:glycosyltransferase family 2 protein n=1 Tax=Ekhidna sp. TaxID=2608089 RepID=UPI0035198F76
MVEVEILIPTYNRCSDLLKNLQILAKQLHEGGLTDRVRILISDNCSPDDTQARVQDFQTSNPGISIHYFRQQSNIGLEPNAVFILGKAAAKYVVWLGDDDYLADGYLNYCFNQINTKENIGVIIPGLASLDKNGNLGAQRIEEFDDIKLGSGYDAVYTYSHLGHQMSGLLMRRDSLLKSYLAKGTYRNPYLFVYFTAFLMLKWDSIYAPIFKTQVSIDNTKDWGYNQVGLLDEVFKSYLALQGMLNDREIGELLIRFSTVHSYRFNIKWYRPDSLLKKYFMLFGNIPATLGIRGKLALQLFKDYVLSFRAL